MDEIQLQRAYYDKTAVRYDTMHGTPPLALGFLSCAIELLGASSLLDVGSGTGRIIDYVSKRHPDLKAVGIEPSAALRQVGHSKGIAQDVLVDGDGTRLQHADASIDLVCAFEALHHIPKPDLAIAEMLRVARKAVFICDANNFGQGSGSARLVKQVINAFGLWPLANAIKTRGKGYIVTEGDGVSYSYSVFTSYALVRSRCANVHIVNLSGDARSPYRGAPQVALLGIKA